MISLTLETALGVSVTGAAFFTSIRDIGGNFWDGRRSHLFLLGSGILKL